MSIGPLPPHLKKYVVEQDYSRYTAIDQAVWRFIMRQLRAYLKNTRTPATSTVLKKPEIETDKIPLITAISTNIEKFGWKAVAVSGFIPPAAFMELQSLSYLPIASDMRSVDHLLYTPAPDIVHEAAGHAPILVEPAFAEYLRRYATVASNAIINRHDLNQYEAIRILSDLKEHPSSTPEQIAAAEARLAEVNATMGEPSEAALLGRMNWWTAEYGLIGTLEQPRIYGAGLLSSVGEALSCMSPDVRKLPFSIECIHFAYDITERQPQLFVTPNFETLSTVLDQLAERMAFRMGGRRSLNRALSAETVNTVELDSGLQISGVLKRIDTLSDDENIIYLQFDGPTQLSQSRKQIQGHGTLRHAQGFGSPLGLIQGKNLATFSVSALERLGLKIGNPLELKFDSGVVVKGILKGSLHSDRGQLTMLTFRNCTVTHGDRILFDPSWGEFDMAVGSKVTSVFGGPADRAAYGETVDFVAAKVSRREDSALEIERQGLYAEIRAVRENEHASVIEPRLISILRKLEAKFPNDWLARLEIVETAIQNGARGDWVKALRNHLDALAATDPSFESPLRNGLKLL